MSLQEQINEITRRAAMPRAYHLCDSFGVRMHSLRDMKVYSVDMNNHICRMDCAEETRFAEGTVWWRFWRMDETPNRSHIAGQFHIQAVDREAADKIHGLMQRAFKEALGYYLNSYLNSKTDKKFFQTCLDCMARVGAEDIERRAAELTRLVMANRPTSTLMPPGFASSVLKDLIDEANYEPIHFIYDEEAMLKPEMTPEKPALLPGQGVW